MASGVVVRTYWDPTGLNNSVSSAYRSSAVAAKGVAMAHRATPRIPVRGPIPRSGAYLLTTSGLGVLFEQGTGPHMIGPGAATSTRTSYSRKKGVTSRTGRKRGGKKALAGALSHPISVPISHPGMREQPFLQPAADAWPTLFKRTLGLHLGKGLR
jgi:hypothetical protein